ncbi:MAG: hypothetical protein Q9160_004427 [Pyrenula sp. 1 TL-2023]
MQGTETEATCTGYRDLGELRIRNESLSVQKRALLKANRSTDLPRALIIPIDTRARDSFFNYFVVGSSKAWDFLKPFYNSTQAPKHLLHTIDAASLAFFYYQTNSDSVLIHARERYVSALRTTSKALQSPDIVASDSTVFATLLLDLFDKITYQDPQEDDTWGGHVAGALALVNLRGLDQFQDFSSLRFLTRLTTNSIICSVSGRSPVSGAVKPIRDFTAKRLLADVKDPKWLLTDLMIEYANLQSNQPADAASATDRIDRVTELDAKLRVLFSNVPPSWQYQTVIINEPSKRVLEGFYNTYPDAHTAQTWNVVRMVRVLLNESLLECCSLLESDSDTPTLLVENAITNNQTLAREICASCPQYLIPQGEENRSGQQNGIYALIFPLYITAWSHASPEPLRQWVLKQLRFMADEFCIRNAAIVADRVEEGAIVPPWTVYAALGSYALAA